jgi:UDP-N-acetylglucosamine transferase subunit ALG13
LIFVTVGAQMHFDRLIRVVDDWAARDCQEEIFAQIGPAKYRPKNIRYVSFMPPVEFRKVMAEADGVVAHAGIGTILTSLELAKPILVVPRQSALGETRNDHQIATARRFQEDGMVLAAFTNDEIVSGIEALKEHRAPERIGQHASAELLACIRDFLEEGE